MNNGLKFLALLKEGDLADLEKALRDDASHITRMIGNDIVKRIVAEGAQWLPTSKRRGPKKEKATNQTDEEVCRLVESVKATIGLSKGISRLDSLTALWGLVGDAEDYFMENLLMSQEEFLQLRGACLSLKELGHPQDADFVSSFTWVFEVNLLDSRFSHTFEELAQESEYRSRRTLPSKEETAVYTGIATTLQMILPDPNAESYKQFGMTRSRILLAGLARVNHIKQVLGKVQYAIDGDMIEEMNRYVDRAFERDLDNKAMYEKVQSLLYDAQQRQGIHPLLRMTLERVNIDPKPFAEGEVNPGGYFGGRYVEEDKKARGRPKSKLGKSRRRP